MAARHQIEPERLLKTLKNTVIKPTKNHTPTDEEILAFVMVANQYGLNPFTKQVHAFASQGGIVPMVGIDGWAELVNRREEFDGCDFDERQSEDGTPLCTTCIMHAKGRQHPVRVTEWFAECKRPTIPWQTMPRRMLRHKAFIQAARICFGLSGIYDEDEARDILRNAKEVVDHAPPVGRGSLRELPTPTQPEVAEEPEPEPEPSREPGDDTAFEQQLQDSITSTALAAQIDEEIDDTRDPAKLREIRNFVNASASKLGPKQYPRLHKKCEDKIDKVGGKK